MRRILKLTRNGIAAASVVARRGALSALGLGLAVTFGLHPASAQNRYETLAPTATSANSVVTATTGNGSLLNLSGTPTVDASYSLLDDTKVTSASFQGGGNSYYATRHLPKNPCNPGCDVSCYTKAEALYMTRQGDNRFSLSRNTFMEDWDFELGARFTYGNLWDCTNGWEAVYVGPFDWERRGNYIANGTLQSQFRPLNGYTGTDITAFNNADQHSQAWRAQMQNFEVNRRWWTWDVVSTLIGVRFLDYEEDYAFFSSRGGVGNGIYTESVDNQAMGAQIGGDIIYPASLRANWGFSGKAGVYANFMERSILMNNAGTLLLNSGDNRVDWSSLIELRTFANYHIVPSIRLTAAYEFWWAGRVATVPEQGPQLISPASGTYVFNRDDLFMHGGSVGVEILF